MPPTDKLQPFLESPSNFTPHAQEVLALARREADRLNHNFVGTEHLLLGLIKLGQGVAVNVLQKIGLDLETVRREVEKAVGIGPDQKGVGHIPYTPRVKKVLALAAKESLALNHAYVGTEHILLGLLREGDGVAGRVLKDLAVDVEQTRQEILNELDPSFSGKSEGAKPSEASQAAGSPNLPPDSIDASKRYDVYCWERDRQVVVYRNVVLKGRSRLLNALQLDLGAELFLELEQSNGQTVHLSLLAVIKFCEHGTEILGERPPPS